MQHFSWEKNKIKQEKTKLKIGVWFLIFFKTISPKPTCGGNVKHRINLGQPNSKKQGTVLLYENRATF